MSFGRAVRITLLLALLGIVALDAWATHRRAISWAQPLWTYVYPIAADDRASTRAYVGALRREDFIPLEAFLAREARRYGVTLEQPLHVDLGGAVAGLPPLPPAEGSPVGVAWWSLKLRWWARGAPHPPGPRGDVRIFVLYYDPATHPAVAHSLGLQKGQLGIVHAFASPTMTRTNNVVIAHEFLHTLGATDKYDPATGLPTYPDGYAEPAREPRFPQAAAELMGGRIPLAPGHAEIPETLDATVVGPATAREIGWVRP